MDVAYDRRRGGAAGGDSNSTRRKGSGVAKLLEKRVHGGFAQTTWGSPLTLFSKGRNRYLEGNRNQEKVQLGRGSSNKGYMSW